MAGAHNQFLLDALRKVNQLRRLVEYRAKRDRAQTSIYMRKECAEHLVLIDLLQRGERYEAAQFLREHLNRAKTMKAPEAGPAGPAPPSLSQRASARSRQLSAELARRSGALVESKVMRAKCWQPLLSKVA